MIIFKNVSPRLKNHQEVTSLYLQWLFFVKIKIKYDSSVLNLICDETFHIERELFHEEVLKEDLKKLNSVHLLFTANPGYCYGKLNQTSSECNLSVFTK